MPQRRIVGKQLQACGGFLDVARGNEEAVSAGGKQIRRRADTVREEQRRPEAAASLTATPHGSWREQGEDVGVDVQLRELASAT